MDLNAGLDLMGIPREGAVTLERGHLIRIVEFFLSLAPPAPLAPAPAEAPPAPALSPLLTGFAAAPAPSLEVAPSSPLLPQGVTFGRVPRGGTMGPVPVQGPPPPHVQIGGGVPSGARVTISPAPGGAPAPVDYAGELQPGGVKIEIKGPDGRALPPIYKDPSGQIHGAEPALLAPPPSALVNPPPPPVQSGLPGFDSVRLAGQITPGILDALDRVVAVGATLEGEAIRDALILSGLVVEVAAGGLELTQLGREASAIARLRLAAGGAS